MNYLHASVTGFGQIINLATLFGLLAGMVWGLLISFMPGVGGNVALVLLLPLMYRLTIPTALALLLGTHIATYFGGSITSITLNIPASAKGLPSCWDGFPLARRGKGAYALGASASAAGIGGVVGAIFLTAGIPVMRSLLDYLGPPEVLLLAVLGAILIAILSSGNLTKGLIAFGIGIMLSFVGQDPITGIDRMTFGSLYLSNGIQVADVAIGLFALVQVVRLLTESMTVHSLPVHHHRTRGERVSLRERLTGSSTSVHGLGAVLRHWKLEIYMATFGVFTGTVPGFGAPVAAVAAYGQAAQFSKDDAEFGDGAIAGVIAPEATESAAEGGGMLPLLSLGIPTHDQQAILLAAFVTLGIAPGPTMLSQHLPLVFQIIWLIVCASVAVMLVGLLLARQFAKLTVIPKHTLVPIILTVSVVGSFAVFGRVGDVVVTSIVGLLGYFLWKYNYSRINLIIGLVLGPIIESNLHIATTLYGDGFMFKRPLSAAITVGIAATIVGWGYRIFRDRQVAKAHAAAEGGERTGSTTLSDRLRVAAAQPGRLITAVGVLGLFALATGLGTTYAPLTGGDVVLLGAFGCGLATLNLARVLAGGQHEEIGMGERLRKSRKPGAPKAPGAPISAPGGAVASTGGAEVGAPAPAPAGGVATAERVAVAESAEIDIEVRGEPTRIADTGRNGVLWATSVLLGFLGLVMVCGIIPGAALGFGLYQIVIRRKPVWYAALMLAVVGMIVWLVFHFVINEYLPYQGFIHFIPL